MALHNKPARHVSLLNIYQTVVPARDKEEVGIVCPSVPTLEMQYSILQPVS